MSFRLNVNTLDHPLVVDGHRGVLLLELLQGGVAVRHQDITFPDQIGEGLGERLFGSVIHPKFD